MFLCVSMCESMLQWTNMPTFRMGYCIPAGIWFKSMLHDRFFFSICCLLFCSNSSECLARCHFCNCQMIPALGHTVVAVIVGANLWNWGNRGGMRPPISTKPKPKWQYHWRLFLALPCAVEFTVFHGRANASSIPLNRCYAWSVKFQLFFAKFSSVFLDIIKVLFPSKICKFYR